MKVNDLIIERQVDAFRASNNIESFGALNLHNLLVKLNVVTIFRPLSADFSGMCVKDNDNHKFMLINSEQSLGRQNFTIAHELYHLFVEENPIPHKCNPNHSNDPIEMQADAFAAALLMPKGGIISLLTDEELGKKRVSLTTVLKLEQYFAVSHQAIVMRLFKLNLISKEQKSELFEVKIKALAEQLGYPTKLYEKDSERKQISSLGEIVYKLYDQDLISQSHYHELLDLIQSYGENKNSTGC